MIDQTFETILISSSLQEETHQYFRLITRVSQIASGKYASESELVRDGLRLIEQRETRIAALQHAITEGLESGVAENFSMEQLQKEWDAE